MKKKILFGFICIVLLLGVTTGCNSKTTANNNSKTNSTKTESKGNCDVFECLDKIDTNATLEDVNKVIGFEGTSESSGNGWEKYEWKLNDDDIVTVTFYKESGKTDIEIEFDEKEKRNSKINLLNSEELSKAIKAGETVTYEDFKKKLGGNGVQFFKDSSSVKYKWIDKDAGTLTASFNSDGKCTIMYGVY